MEPRVQITGLSATTWTDLAPLPSCSETCLCWAWCENASSSFFLFNIPIAQVHKRSIRSIT